MRRKIIAFDLDDTVTVSKSPVAASMAATFAELLEVVDVAVISGGRFEQFRDQLVASLPVGDAALERLHILPTSGTRYYRYDRPSGEWHTVYVEDLAEDEKERIVATLLRGAEELGLVEPRTYGPVIEDRGSQITYSALGQEAPPEVKYEWDPDAAKKRRLRDFAAPLLPDMSVRTGGSTSVDVTRRGIDKSYGISRLIEHNGLQLHDVLFFGDQLQEGGNDHPVLEMGVDCIAVRNWQETEVALRAILLTCSAGRSG